MATDSNVIVNSYLRDGKKISKSCYRLGNTSPGSIDLGFLNLQILLATSCFCNSGRFVIYVQGVSSSFNGLNSRISVKETRKILCHLLILHVLVSIKVPDVKLRRFFETTKVLDMFKKIPVAVLC